MSELWAWIVTLPSLRGVTLTGGEPFEQSLALAELARRVRGQGLDVIAFSGYRIEELQSGVVPHSELLLREIDVLVDGRFVRDLPSSEPLRSSSNQRVHYLTDRISDHALRDLPRTELVSGEYGATLSGFALQASVRRIQALRLEE